LLARASGAKLNTDARGTRLQCKGGWGKLFVVKEKQDESFRVVDRRLFTAEGELRQEVADEKDRGQARELTKTQAPAADAATTLSAATTAPVSSPAPAPNPSSLALDASPPIPPSHGFQLIVDVLARNAEMMMGGMPDPRTGQAYLELEGAREMIDMLDTLREKTRGNLAPEDEALLRDVLGALKLNYMQLTKAAAEAVRAKAKP
jgi:hypothetical protein